jgi:hypothetical protein
MGDGANYLELSEELESAINYAKSLERRLLELESAMKTLQAKHTEVSATPVEPSPASIGSLVGTLGATSRKFSPTIPPPEPFDVA